MKILQLNIWNGRLLKNIIELIETEKPDILCLQEVVSFDGEIYSMFGTVEELQEKVPYKEIYYSPGIQFRFMHKSAEWGNSLHSQFPILGKTTKFTNLDYIKNFNFDDYDYNARNFQHCTLETGNGKILHVLNHHGHHLPNHKSGDTETLRQMKQLGEYIEKLKGPVILTGDFNLAPHSESLEQINKRLVNLPVKHRLKTTRTALTHKKEVCDYIFVSDEVKVKNFKASDEIVSDHKALVLDFDI